MCAAEVQALCFFSPLCEDFAFAVIVLELDCAVEWVICTDHRPWASLQFLFLNDSLAVCLLFFFSLCWAVLWGTRGRVRWLCGAATSCPGGERRREKQKPLSWEMYWGTPGALLSPVYWIKVKVTESSAESKKKKERKKKETQEKAIGLTLKKPSEFNLKSLSAMNKNLCTKTMKESSWANVLLLHSLGTVVSI